LTRNEQRAFRKFFFTYFISVALLILVAGHFFYTQARQQLLEREHFALIEYAKRLKVGESTQGFDGFEHRYERRVFDGFDIGNFSVRATRFEKWVPANEKGVFLFVSKQGSAFQAAKERLFIAIAGIQLALLLLFAILSYRLASSAIAPLQQSIEKLDRFAKDLIHDLNTPVTSIGLNLKALRKEPTLHEHPALQRLQRSADAISELHKNLLALLREEAYMLEAVALDTLVTPLLSEYRQRYPGLAFETEALHTEVQADSVALGQVLDNLLSNACKYSRETGTIRMYFRDKTLTISDEGVGIKHPERAFERNYTEHAIGSGIGLDIVKRLCGAMQITVTVTSSPGGTTFTLTFR